ncbi:hypothetical protein B0H66DRAFT_595156 [Apodospora peruviana]|uniref:DUF6590 domain-containing protein n=1 Tax=Apodospora peruviana TaxID=516989 RepID=A0AAE0LZH6_9PEZI|nr:hypothetical protein B0H66DRAFT_595156 [Apodospora peruviana]
MCIASDRVQYRHVLEDYPTAAVKTILDKFLDKLFEKSLLVVYYHRFGSINEEGRMVFSSGNGSSFFWDDIRDPIMQAPGDVLLIFDCCPIPGLTMRRKYALPLRKAEQDWTDDCPAYREVKPIVKFRWFIVVRKRLRHSLCFNITTIGPNGVRKVDRGQAMDFVVLHNANIEPSEPFEEESIMRLPITVIIEASEESISPWARLDCGRIYTVENNLRVLKLGQVHPDSLLRLEEYFTANVS